VNSDPCGVTRLAGKAVGAPFCRGRRRLIAMAEALPLGHGGPLHHRIALDLQSPERPTVAGRAQTFEALNPGFLEVPAE
jgi:hypothetical protein